MGWRFYQDFPTTFELNEFFVEAGEFNVQQTTRWSNRHIKAMHYRCMGFKKTQCPFTMRVDYPRPNDATDRIPCMSGASQKVLSSDSICVYLKSRHNDSCKNSFNGDNSYEIGTNDKGADIQENGEKNEVPHSFLVELKADAEALRVGEDSSSVSPELAVNTLYLGKSGLIGEDVDTNVCSDNSKGPRRRRNRTIHLPKRFRDEESGVHSAPKKIPKIEKRSCLSPTMTESTVINGGDVGSVGATTQDTPKQRKSHKAQKLDWKIVGMYKSMEDALAANHFKQLELHVDHNTNGQRIMYRCRGHRKKSGCDYHLKIMRKNDIDPVFLLESCSHTVICRNFGKDVQSESLENDHKPQWETEISENLAEEIEVSGSGPDVSLSFCEAENNGDAHTAVDGDNVKTRSSSSKVPRHLSRKRRKSAGTEWKTVAELNSEEEWEAYKAANYIYLKRNGKSSVPGVRGTWYRCGSYRKTDCPFNVKVMGTPTTENPEKTTVMELGKHVSFCPNLKKLTYNSNSHLKKTGKKRIGEEDLSPEDKAVLQLIPPTPPAIVTLEGSRFRKTIEKVARNDLDQNKIEDRLKSPIQSEECHADRYAESATCKTEKEFRKLLKSAGSEFELKREEFWPQTRRHQALCYKCADPHCLYHIAAFFPNPSLATGAIKILTKGSHRPECTSIRKESKTEEPRKPTPKKNKGPKHQKVSTLSTASSRNFWNREEWKDIGSFKKKSELYGFLRQYAVEETNCYRYADGTIRRSFLKCKSCHVEISVHFPPLNKMGGSNTYQVAAKQSEHHESVCLKLERSEIVCSKKRNRRNVELPEEVESTISSCIKKMTESGFSVPATFVAGIARIVGKKVKGSSFSGFPGYSGDWLDKFLTRNGLTEISENRGSPDEEKLAQQIMGEIEQKELACV